MKKKYTALEIASFFIGRKVSPLKLQKLLYYSQVWFYVKHGDKLFDEDIKAWKYGPVVPAVWRTFKWMRRSDMIRVERADDYRPEFTKDTYHDNVINILLAVWDAYGHLPGPVLVDTTHAEKPWQMSRGNMNENLPSGNEVIIDDQTTQDFIFVNGRVPKKEVTINLFGRY